MTHERWCGHLWPLAVLCATSCEYFDVKVPIQNVNAGFVLAEATWFEAEQTLFFFYRVDAEQGIGEKSRIEVAWRTDDERVPLSPLSAFEPVHTHVDVDCGPRSLCGSYSVHVPLPPRDVEIQLRYHEDGALLLRAPTNFNSVAAGPPFETRSLIVYGVFDETNRSVQWRARHQFPTIRNEEAEDLGLRRRFEINDQRYGVVDRTNADFNPYLYAEPCDPSMVALDRPPLETIERAIFEPEQLPFDASTAPAVCARSTVDDALGTFDANAVAFKNPEVEPAFPLLRSPIKDNTALGFMLQICNREISPEHLAVQQQRLQLENAPVICVDDFESPTFATTLAGQLSAAIDEERINGDDMVLVLALHHDDERGGLGLAVEAALRSILTEEQDKSSPRVSGAFLLDSFGHATAGDLSRFVLWCPSFGAPGDLDDVSGASQACALLPDQEIGLGPFRFFTSLPVFPSREQYLTFINKHSVDEAGRVLDLSFRAPERTAQSQNVPLGDFGIATFFNNEVLTAAPTDTFSFCPDEEQGFAPVVFKSGEFIPEPVPLSLLPDIHADAQLPLYELGLAWDFPYLFQVEYETFVGGALNAYGLTVPFGLKEPTDQFFGSQIWNTGEFPLDKVLLRCSRFCDHPTFDSAGVYNVRVIFSRDMRNQCYRPDYPGLRSGGFPNDP
jgi:hypothetical protein